MSELRLNQDAPSSSAGKWIEGLESGMRLPEAAHHVLTIRLRAAHDLFTPVAESPVDDLDRLRKARVATRRARASIDAFRSLLPKGARKRIRSRLKEMRGFAGEPRSCWLERDALVARLAGATPTERLGLAFAAGRLDAMRLFALERLATANQRVDLGAYCEDVRKCLKRLDKSRDNRTLGEHASAPLERVENDLASAATEHIVDLEQLHMLRLDIKRLRYTYEMFRCCIDEERFLSVYKAAKTTQDRLGEMNDLHETVERVRMICCQQTDLTGPIVGSLRAVLDRLESERDAARDTFVLWWRADETGEASTLRNLRSRGDTPGGESHTLRAAPIDRSIRRSGSRLSEISKAAPAHEHTRP